MPWRIAVRTLGAVRLRCRPDSSTTTTALSASPSCVTGPPGDCSVSQGRTILCKYRGGGWGVQEERFGWLVGWLRGWVVMILCKNDNMCFQGEWLVGWLVYSLVVWLVGWLSGSGVMILCKNGTCFQGEWLVDWFIHWLCG